MLVASQKSASSCVASSLVLALLVALMTGVAAQGASGERSAAEARGRAVLRDMDCARCHGGHYDGWAAPSLIAAVRDGTRERFDRMVLEGDVVRGMPGYRSQPRVVAELDAIYAYLLARASEQTGAGPSAAGR